MTREDPNPGADGPPLLVAVALPIPVREEYTYAVPTALRDRIAPGARVLVPLGSRRVTGFCTAIPAPLAVRNPREILAVVDDEPLLSAPDIELARWIARRYASGLGEALASFLPRGVRRHAEGRRVLVVRPAPAPDPAALEALAGDRRAAAAVRLHAALVGHGEGVEVAALLRTVPGAGRGALLRLVKAGLATVGPETRIEDPFRYLRLEPVPDPALNPDQERAVAAIGAPLAARRHASFLLFGVTASGKTEVYIRLLRQTVAGGRGAIVLVPEISLTPQTVERFQSRVGGVAVLHSHLSDADRARQWKRLRAGECRIAVGPRSAVFAPVREPGLIILDEEHETTFKQQNAPRYHARDVARRRAEISGAVLVLGSATPSLESWQDAASGRSLRLDLPVRATGGALPEVRLIDLRAEAARGAPPILSRPLVFAMRTTLGEGGQVLLFLNRKGWATSVLCRLCGHIATCSRCSVSVTYHRSDDILLCHVCGRVERPPEACPSCANPQVHWAGVGTERLEAEVNRLFPGTAVARMDAATMRGRFAHDRLFRDLREGKIRVLVGTQMIAKGLDIPDITLIGVIAADLSLAIPDFRAAERTFQLVAQVAGRAGRGDRPGRVFVQTSLPGHYALRSAARHDFPGFAAEELRHRREMGYPPFGHLVRLVFQGPDPEAVRTLATRVSGDLAAHPTVAAGDVRLSGPAPAPLALIKDEHRHHALLVAADGEILTEVIEATPSAHHVGRHARVIVDRDPVTLA